MRAAPGLHCLVLALLVLCGHYVLTERGLLHEGGD